MKEDQPAVHGNPRIMGGTPVFVGTRVPFQTLLDNPEAGQPLSDFLDDFPTGTRYQSIAALEQAKEALLARARATGGVPAAPNTAMMSASPPVAFTLPGGRRIRLRN